QTVLGGLVVVGRNGKDTADANGSQLAGERDDLGGIVTARARQHGNLAFGRFHPNLDDAQVLLALECRNLARRAAPNEQRDPGLDLALHEAAQRGLIERSIDLKRGDQGGTASDKHCWLLPKLASS